VASARKGPNGVLVHNRKKLFGDRLERVITILACSTLGLLPE
jgi:hypothetical protein